VIIDKAALLILNKKQSKFLVCRPNKHNEQYIMPGGKIEEGESDVKCLVREIKEELSVKVNPLSLSCVGIYSGPTALEPERIVRMRVYAGKIIGVPKASSEILSLHWIGKNDQTNEKVSLFIRQVLMPDLILRGILK